MVIPVRYFAGNSRADSRADFRVIFQHHTPSEYEADAYLLSYSKPVYRNNMRMPISKWF